MPNYLSKSITKLGALMRPLEESYDLFQYRNETRLGEIRTHLAKRNVFSTFDADVDELFLHALRHYDNLHTALILGATRRIAFDEYYAKSYREDYILLGIKTVFLRKCDVEKMIYQIHYERHQAKHIDDFRRYFRETLGMDDWSGFTDLPEEGDCSNLRMTLLIMMDRHVPGNPAFHHLPEGVREVEREDAEDESHMVLIPRNPLEQWLMTSLFFNDASLKFLEYQQLDFYLKTENKGTWRAMDSFRRNLLETVGLKEMHRMMLFSSTILYFLGHRPNNDFDTILFSKSGFSEPDTETEALLALQAHENASALASGEKGPYDFTFKNSPLRKAFFEDHLDLWARQCGARHFEEMIGNGDRHMYFLGMKSTTVYADIQKRILRNRPRAIADLIALKKRYSLPNFPAIPAPPRTVKKYCKPGDLTEEEIARKDAKPFSKYGIEELEYEEPVDREQFLNTVRWALRERYHMEFDEQEVMQEMGLAPRRATTTYTIKARTKEAQEEATKAVLRVKNATTGEVIRVKNTTTSGEVIRVKNTTTSGEVTRVKVAAPAPAPTPVIIVEEEKPTRRLKVKIKRTQPLA